MFHPDSHQLTTQCVWVSLPREFLYSSPSSFIPYFLVYVNRSKAFFRLRGRARWSNTMHDQWLWRDLTSLINVFHTQGTAEMKKFTSGANGHMFSLFRRREKEEEKETENKVWERKGCIFFSLAHCSASSSWVFWLHGRVTVGKLRSREESGREKSCSKMFH